jgi:hypothetical protein
MTLLLQTFSISADTGEKLVYGIIGAAFSALCYWLITRRKSGSETDRNYQQMALDISASLAVWIKKFEDGQKEMIEVVQQMGAVQKALDDCSEERDDCKRLLDQAQELLARFESAIKDLAEYGHLIEDLVTLKRRVSRFTNLEQHQTGA